MSDKLLHLEDSISKILQDGEVYLTFIYSGRDRLISGRFKPKKEAVSYKSISHCISLGDFGIIEKPCKEDQEFIATQYRNYITNIIRTFESELYVHKITDFYVYILTDIKRIRNLLSILNTTRTICPFKDIDKVIHEYYKCDTHINLTQIAQDEKYTYW